MAVNQGWQRYEACIRESRRHVRVIRENDENAVGRRWTRLAIEGAGEQTGDGRTDPGAQSEIQSATGGRQCSCSSEEARCSEKDGAGKKKIGGERQSHAGLHRTDEGAAR